MSYARLGRMGTLYRAESYEPASLYVLYVLIPQMQRSASPTRLDGRHGGEVQPRRAPSHRLPPRLLRQQQGTRFNRNKLHLQF